MYREESSGIVHTRFLREGVNCASGGGIGVVCACIL